MHEVAVAVAQPIRLVNQENPVMPVTWDELIPDTLIPT